MHKSGSDRCCRKSLCRRAGLLLLVWFDGEAIYGSSTRCAGRSLAATLTHNCSHAYNSYPRRLWRLEQLQRHCLQVLHDGGEMEFVAGAGQTSQAQPLEPMVGLQMCEPHLDPLALVA